MSTPKILYINPVGTDAFDEHYMRVLESAARPETKVKVISFKPIDDDLITVSLYIGETLRAVIRAEKDGYDAVIIGCAGDPALMESKRAVNIPVVAVTEASLHVASMLGRFSAVVPSGAGTYIKDLALQYGLSHMLASVKSANVVRPSNENKIAKEDPKKHRQVILDLFQKAMKETVSGAVRSAVMEDQSGWGHHLRAIIFGCTFFAGWEKERIAISEELKTALIDPVIVSLEVAEMHIDNSSRCYTPSKLLKKCA